MCISNFDILYQGLTNALLILKRCPFPYIFYNLRVTYKGISHANSILINTKNGNFTRYEPHGSKESWGDLDVNLTKIAIMNNVAYELPCVSCPFYGIQSMMIDNVGFCQTSVLYNLLSKLDKNYNYIKTTSRCKTSKNEILSLMTSLLLNIYQKLPNNLKSVFLGYNTLTIFQKKTLEEAIIITQTQN